MTSEASLSDSTPESYQSDAQARSESSSHQSPDTEDEIAQARVAKSKKTLKRKHRATDASNFGATLQSLLKTDTPSGLPLSLKPSVARKRNDEKLELRAKKLLKGEKKNKEEVARIKDVIGGWGGESERALRKVAQRGGETCPHHLLMYLLKGKQSGQTLQCHPAISSQCSCCRKRTEKHARVGQAHITRTIL